MKEVINPNFNKRAPAYARCPKLGYAELVDFKEDPDRERAPNILNILCLLQLNEILGMNYLRN